MKIHADRTAIFNAINYNEIAGKGVMNGIYKGTIDSIAYNQLVQTIEYINMPTLKSHYAVGWTDDQSVKLEVIYGNGQIKTITDYGAIGTFGLSTLYDQLFSWRETQQWER